MDAWQSEHQTEFMAKRKPELRMRTIGIYTKWESAARTLPKISEVTTKVTAVVDVEFGFIVNVTGGKNQEMYYCIDHPGILDDQGKRRPPFDGTVYIKTNDWDFYLGDTIWEPINDKLGNWQMTLELDGKVVADKTFELLAAQA